MTTSISTETLNSMILDAGVVYINYGEVDEKILGATEGGNTFNVTRQIKNIAVDGARGKVKGLRRLISEDASIVTRLKELKADNIKIALAGSEITDVEDDVTMTVVGKKVSTKASAQGTTIPVADYLKNIALVASVSGTSEPVVIMLYNALSDGEFSIGLVDTEEAVVPVTFSAHYDPANMTAPIYDITFPVVAP